MIRFEAFERLGVSVAGISEACDADCGTRSPENAEHRTAVCQSCGIDAQDLVYARQVHGATVIQVGESDRRGGEGGGPLPAADAMATNVPGLPLAVFVADCVPVYLFDPRSQALALVHAGRAGTLRNIAGAALARLTEAFGTRPGDLHALVGPSAGPCCYEVSEDIAKAFRDAGLPTRGRHLDLWEANAIQLAAAGVPREQIEMTGICTICDTRFFSYRRGAQTCRNMAFLAL